MIFQHTYSYTESAKPAVDKNHKGQDQDDSFSPQKIADKRKVVS